VVPSLKLYFSGFSSRLCKGRKVRRINPGCHSGPLQSGKIPASSPATPGNLFQGLYATISLLGFLCLLACLGLGCAAKTRRPDLRQQAVKFNDEGYQYYRQSRWRLARHKFTRALDLNRLIDYRPGIAANLNNLGALAQEQGNLGDAARFYQEALTLQREIGNPAGLCETLNNLGTVYAGMGRWSEARNFYLEALDYARRLPPGPLLALTLTHQGDVALHDRNYQRALDLYREALRIDQARKNRAGMAIRYARLGRVYLELSNYVTARQYLLSALEESRRLELTSGVIDALDGLTHLALAQDNRLEARRYGERLLKIYQARGQTRDAEKLREILGPGKQPHAAEP
jgi:tetratricopeptide (TPR) repeat protein